MAFSTVNISSDEWTLIGDNVSIITAINLGQYPMYLNFNSSNTAPADTVGLPYKTFDGPVKADVTSLTSVATPNYVFAKAFSKSIDVLVET